LPGLESMGSAPPTPAGIGNVKIGYFTRTPSEGPGVQSITGVGFKPKVVIFFAGGPSGTYRTGSFGFDDGINAHCIGQPGDSDSNDEVPDISIQCFIDPTNSIYGRITSMDDDGFTITWTQIGNGECWVKYLAMK